MNNNSQSFGGLIFHEGDGLTSKNFKKKCSIDEFKQLEQLLKNPKLLDNLNLKEKEQFGLLFPINIKETKNFKKKYLNINCSLTKKQIDFINKYRNKLNLIKYNTNTNKKPINTQSLVKQKIDIPFYKSDKIKTSKSKNQSSFNNTSEQPNNTLDQPNNTLDQPNNTLDQPNNTLEESTKSINRLPGTIR